MRGGGAAVESAPRPNGPLGAAERRAAVNDGDALRPSDRNLAPERDPFIGRERPAEHNGGPMPGAPEGVWGRARLSSERARNGE